jgi:hypothetical protein
MTFEPSDFIRRGFQTLIAANILRGSRFFL